MISGDGCQSVIHRSEAEVLYTTLEEPIIAWMRYNAGTKKYAAKLSLFVPEPHIHNTELP